MNAPFLRYFLVTGFAAGVLDIVAAYLHQFIKSGVFPAKMLHYIAGGALGLEAAMQGGLGTQLLGLAFHFLIAFAFTLLFFVLATRFRWLVGQPFVTGPIYGVFVGVMMTFVVLPLSALPPRKEFNLLAALPGWLILATAVGLPIALGAARLFRRPSEPHSANP